MTRQALVRSVLSLGLFLLATAAVADRGNDEKEGNGARLVLPVTGSAGFSGTLFIQRFEVRNGQAVAVGFVSGSIAGRGSALVGPIALPVTASPQGSGTAGRGALQQAPSSPQQTASTCTALDLQLGAASFNVLGLVITTQPVGITLAGDTASPLGNLVCTALDTLNNVVNLVGILNQLLGALGGALGGVAGGLTGGVTG
jgi:hypothetical protein